MNLDTLTEGELSELFKKTLKLRNDIQLKLNKKSEDIIDEKYPEINSLIENPKNKKTKKQSDNDYYSLTYLLQDYAIFSSITQSQKIRLSIEMERILIKIIEEKSSLTNIKPKNKKDVSEKDHLFMNDTTIFYAEVKSNIYLDTEKKKATVAKIKKICEELKKEYPDKEIKSYLLASRYLTKEEVPQTLLKTRSYDNIRERIIGVNDYFAELGIEKTFTLDEYKSLLFKIIKKM